MPTTAEQAAQTAAATPAPWARSGRKAAIAQGFDLVAHEYGTGSGGFFTTLGTRLAAAAGLRRGDRVLDLGCGRGAVLFAAAEAVGPDGYAAGIDLSPAMVHATADEAARRGLRNVAVRVGDAEDPGFPAHSFEAVLAGLMMFITPDPDAALAAVRRVLVPGGRFAMSTFGPAEPGWAEALDAALAFQDPPPAGAPTTVKGGNGRFDTVDGITGTLAAAGFTEVATVEGEHVARIDADQWWASAWASGRRAALERIPADRREEARRAAFAVVERLYVDGVLTRRTTVRITTATGPATAEPVASGGG
ncbi:methyltransferase domain-containing protein [Streptacidiphilus sp. PB12-B1b]|uniref:class I SAM-dependent methyltransferase n=1 Tax=Streptacidiphilus sp. PB12-B1b TaxID=2705012 RepID=UPI0015FBAE34|nr:methyltransferase domain-containing protein [Streptacidiphilus sp. PB12-B1b]QMU74945.1 methyltransferase domain-containing protein [Streptacidiphilus sp. PB12-B1b]